MKNSSLKALASNIFNDYPISLDDEIYLQGLMDLFKDIDDSDNWMAPNWIMEQHLKLRMLKYKYERISM